MNYHFVLNDMKISARATSKDKDRKQWFIYLNTQFFWAIGMH